MPVRTKKLIGTFVLVIFVIVYAFTAMLIAQAPSIRAASTWVQTIFFAVAGIAWAFPVMPVIRWMERDPSIENTR